MGCESSTTYGACVGVNEQQNPRLHYKVSVQNLVVGVIFIETIVVPIVVAVDELFCPVEPADPAPAAGERL